VAEAILACKQIEELAFVDSAAGCAFPQAHITKFANDLLMRNRPSDRSDGES
jgi:hypothetical protein